MMLLMVDNGDAPDGGCPGGSSPLAATGASEFRAREVPVGSGDLASAAEELGDQLKGPSVALALEGSLGPFPFSEA